MKDNIISFFCYKEFLMKKCLLLLLLIFSEMLEDGSKEENMNSKEHMV